MAEEEVPCDPKRYVEKKHICSICGYRSISKWRLKRHFVSCSRKFAKYNSGALPGATVGPAPVSAPVSAHVPKAVQE